MSNQLNEYATAATHRGLFSGIQDSYTGNSLSFNVIGTPSNIYNITDPLLCPSLPLLGPPWPIHALEGYH